VQQPLEEKKSMDNYADNLKKIRELAEEVKILDLLNPSSDVVNLLTEIIDRCKKIPELEMIDDNFINMDNFEAEA
jgi:hypothetical protein